MSRGNGKYVYAVFALLALMMIGLVLFGGYFNWKPLLNVDWQAVGALGTFAAVVVAMWLASQEAIRRRNDRVDNSRVLALILAPELERTRTHVVSLRQLLMRQYRTTIKRPPERPNEPRYPDEIVENWQGIASWIGDLELPTFRSAYSSLYAFDASDVAMLAKTSEDMLRLKKAFWFVNSPIPKDTNPIFDIEGTLAVAVHAQESINRTTDRILKIAGRWPPAAIDAGTRITEEEVVIHQEAITRWLATGRLELTTSEPPVKH